jgi:hypothetical protein
MKINKFLFLLFLWVLIFSCKKDDAIKITYPSAYHKSGLKTAGDLRVFSSNGEIRDKSVISRFNQTDTSNFSIVADYIKNNRGTLDSITISDVQHATVYDRYSPLNCLFIQERDRLILTSTDTITGYSSGNEFTQNPDYYIGQVKPEVYAEYLISSTGGNYQFGYTAREKFIFHNSGGQLVAPFIIFMVHRKQVEYGGSMNNILQNDFFKKLPSADTVTLKEYLVLYEK